MIERSSISRTPPTWKVELFQVFDVFKAEAVWDH